MKIFDFPLLIIRFEHKLVIGMKALEIQSI